ncbi:MAG: BON domain-containing protein [Burkholderiales bacterium]|nr:BON domain-containing protein [Burkholderiales bacterium]
MRSIDYRLCAGAAGLACALFLAGCFEAVVIGGAATGALVATDRRAAEVVLGDERIELTAASRIGQRFADKIHVNVTSFNYAVLLSGEAPDEKTKAEIERIASQVERVKGVVNELRIAAPSSLSARGNDTYLTGRIKASFVTANRFHSTHVKVVTENSTVFLLGLVTRQEADAATEIARGTPGVHRVIRVFEYLAAAPK